MEVAVPTAWCTWDSLKRERTTPPNLTSHSISCKTNLFEKERKNEGNCPFSLASFPVPFLVQYAKQRENFLFVFCFVVCLFVCLFVFLFVQAINTGASWSLESDLQ